jgi:FlaA1/EpsC-like NDP-sugar epimerase
MSENVIWWKNATRWKRSLFFLFGDAVLIFLALFLAFFLRYEGQIPSTVLANLGEYSLIIALIKFPIFYLFGLYRMSWRFVSLKELLAVFQAVTASALLIAAMLFILGREPWLGIVPRSIPVLDYILTLILIGGFRASKRIFTGLRSGFSGGGKRVLIAGAGDAGEQIARAMQKEVRSDYVPIGYIDDDAAKRGLSIHGVRVLGSTQDLGEISRKRAVEGLIIAMPSAPSSIIREIMELGRAAGIRDIKILPGFHELVTGQVGLSDIREVQLEDLLGREPVEIDATEIGSNLKGKVVLVTGAAGSIGSELCRQINRFSPKILITLDQDESGLFHIENELSELVDGVELRVEICDIRDRAKLQKLFELYSPHVVFHAAAYKHVPMMEAHPDESIKNNILGTLAVAEISMQSGAEKFVLISTDKAVNPSSIMGATKRVAELLICSLNEQSQTSFVAVRFGNVLGSRGSVIPEFQRQIKQGGPVTITHEDMERYFMVTSEAALLVMQAGAMGQGGEVFVLDMGDPVKIIELARELIRLSGFEPDTDIPISITGLRPGEKLYEELFTAEEGTAATQHKKIYVANLDKSIFPADFDQQIGRLESLAVEGDREKIVRALGELVPTFQQESSLNIKQ